MHLMLTKNVIIARKNQLKKCFNSSKFFPSGTNFNIGEFCS